MTTDALEPSRARAIWTTVATSFRADRWRSIGSLLLFGIGPPIALLGALWLKEITDAVVRHDGGAVALWVIVLGASDAVSLSITWLGISVLIPLMENTGFYIDHHLMQFATSIPTLEHHEQPEHADRLELVRQQRGTFAGSPAAVVQLVSAVLQLLVTGVLLARLDLRLLLLPLFGIPSLLAGVVDESIRQGAVERTAEAVRRCRHLFNLSTTPGPAKELRIFGLGRQLLGRHHATWTGVQADQDRAAVKGAVIGAAGWVVFALGYGIAVLMVVDKAARGQATVGDVVLALSLAATVNSQLSQLVGMSMFFTQCVKAAARFLWLSGYATTHQSAATGRPPAALAQGIDFENVSFRYPGTEGDVLRDVTLHIPAGTTVAVVGDNGAGKSTFVKLLCKYYEPSDGRIAIDGVDLTQIEPAAWRARLSSGFQDFARLELLARETVGVGDLPRVDDDSAVTEALARAGASDVPADLPQQLDTQLGRSFGDGAELSGGQWQKLALGRAMMRESPLLLVLDEPTASLDAETEHALFERYAGAASRASSANGGVTVLVSHRFSTVRMADVIVVIDGGCVVESGSHEDLMAAGGLYAELFDLQARAYR